MREREFRLFRLFDVSQPRACHELVQRNEEESLSEAYSMPRSTSGIAVSIDSELVTLPSSPGLRSTLYR